MTRMQKEMQERISREQLDQAFDARFPEEMQTKLRNARVAVAGLGGLGSNIAVMLARSGVGELLLVDFDTVDVTNLNRQMYLIPQLGKPKAEALPEILYQINPYLTYRSVCIKVTPDNVKELFSEYPIVCEAFDKPDQKAMLVRELLMQCPKTTVVSGNGMAGYADANEIRTCQVMKRLYVCGDQSTDVGNGIGLIAPRVAVCAAHEANKVLQLIMQTES
ncbi:MAG: sulfur carrier protein ThiS adenylyltransferase ThiF [Candidatus Choladocola sp.]|nr:sulfur carrier protein ThiS adenylyltransferase ThiF [Clostridiaceae bacterium]MDY4545928.1 sulfur carrier protein ThiS adenylyltransferase ThiF [Candidatus Choladocola sp.]